MSGKEWCYEFFYLKLKKLARTLVSFFVALLLLLQMPSLAWASCYPPSVMAIPLIFADVSGPSRAHFGDRISMRYSWDVEITIYVMQYCESCTYNPWLGYWCMPYFNNYSYSSHGKDTFRYDLEARWYDGNMFYSFNMEDNGTCYVPLTPYDASGWCDVQLLIPSYMPEGNYSILFYWAGSYDVPSDSYFGGIETEYYDTLAATNKTITIYNNAPTLSLQAPSSAYSGQVIRIWATATDPDGDPINSYKWIIDGKDTSSTQTPYIDISWATPGQHSISAQAQDIYGKWSSPANATVTVTANRPPVAALKIATPSPIYAGGTITADGTGSYDPDPGDAIAAAMWYYQKPGGNWVGPVTQSVQGSFGLTWTLNPDVSGQWNVKLIVKDSHGTESAPAYASFDVLDVPPPIIDGGGSCYTTPTPRISWTFSQPQSAYQAVIRSSSGNVVYDTGKVISSQNSFNVPPGVLWASGDYRFTVQVRAWNAAGYASGWSAPAGFCVTAFERPRVVEIVNPPPGQTAPTLSGPILIAPGTRAANLPRIQAGSKVGVEVDGIGIDSLVSAVFPYLNRTAVVGSGTPRVTSSIGTNKTWLIEFWTDASKAVVPDGIIVKMQLDGRGANGGAVNFGLPPYADGVAVISDTAYSDWFVVLQGRNTY